MTARKQHAGVYYFLRFLLGGIIRRIYHFDPGVPINPPGPYLVVSNHNTDLDAVLVAMSFSQHMYFVASEHVFRKGLASWLLRTFFAPIARVKGSTDAQAALDVMRALHRGENVCLFAEGSRSFSGVSDPIFPATGKLATASGAALITYRIVGGYLTTPRWSQKLRKGKMSGSAVNIYTPAQLEAITPAEINAHITADLYEDAFKRQEQERVAYRGKNLAVGLENSLFLCPKCGGIGTLVGKGDNFTCTCGFSVRYNVYGFFEGEDLPFSCVRDWDSWQQQKLVELAKDGELTFTDPDMQLFSINRRHRMRMSDKGTLSMDKEAIRLGGTCLPLAGISRMALVGSSRLVFTAAGQHYEIRAAERYFCGRKYYMLHQQYSK